MISLFTQDVWRSPCEKAKRHPRSPWIFARMPCFYLIALTFQWFCTGCTGKLDAEEYCKWVADPANGLHVQRVAGEYEFDLQFEPAAFRMARYGEGSQDDSDLEYFSLKIRPRQTGSDVLSLAVDEQDEQRRIYYFSYLFQQDVWLEYGNDRFPCVLYHMESAIDSRGNRTFLLAFDSGKEGMSHEQGRIVIVSDRLSSFPIGFTVNRNKIPKADL